MMLVVYSDWLCLHVTDQMQLLCPMLSMELGLGISTWTMLLAMVTRLTSAPVHPTQTRETALMPRMLASCVTRKVSVPLVFEPKKLVDTYVRTQLVIDDVV